MASKAGLIAQAVLERYDGLPSKRKPLIRDNGAHEWVPLSGIVAEREGNLSCLALATGMKCLPSSKLDLSHGVGLHDWHAEVLALRTLNRFILDECRRLLVEPRYESPIVTRHDDEECWNHDPSRRPFKIRDDVKIHMYCSEAPCGDASMELIMAAQEDASPWTIPPSPERTPSDTIQPNDTDTSLPGRAYFSQLGVVRRKPARGDAPMTLSKSCSDKIALKQCTSFLSSLTSFFVSPENAYIDTLVLPQSQYSEEACRRAFSAEGRMSKLANRQWKGGFSFKPLRVDVSDGEFAFSKRAVQSRSKEQAASNLAVAWSMSGWEESVIGGVLQGRKAFDEKGASRTSRRQMWLCACEITASLQKEGIDVGLGPTDDEKTYEDVKNSPILIDRQEVKDEVRANALVGWVRNAGDSAFCLGKNQT